MKRYMIPVIFLLLLLCGCTKPEPAEQLQETTPIGSEPQKAYVYHRQEITYSEPSVQYGFRANMDCTETTFARYYFEPSIEETDRARCIAWTDIVLQSQMDPLLYPEIYVFTEKRFPDVFVADKKLYISVQDWKTPEYTANVLLAAYGPYSHYGLAYGFANLICNLTILERGSVIPESMDAADLSLLCFDTAFVSESDLETVKWHACRFVQDYAAEKGEAALQELLSASDTAAGAVAVSEALSRYYLSNGIDYAPTTLRFGHGGHSFSYTVFSELATFSVKKDWVDMNSQINPLVYDGFLRHHYEDIKAFFQINLDQMAKYQALFKLESYNNDLSVIFADTNMSRYSFYQSNTHRIYLKNVDSLMHEYIHALTLARSQSAMENWEIEGFARYYSYRYDHYGIALLNHDYNHLAQTAVTGYVYEYLDQIQRPIDMASDYEEIENLAVWYFGLRDPNANYLAGSSFVQYLVKQYGDQAVIQSVYGDKTPLPKPYAELVSDWLANIENRYQDYSQYEN